MSSHPRHGTPPAPPTDGACGTFVSHLDGCPQTVLRDGPVLTVRHTAGSTMWALESTSTGWTLSPQPAWPDPDNAATGEHTRAVLAALDALFATQPDLAQVTLPIEARHLAPSLLANGSLQEGGHGLIAHRASLWQLARLWQATAINLQPFAQRHVITEGRRHPLRPPKPEGEVYRRHIPWLGLDFSLRALQPAHDLDLLHRWMNDPSVDHFWQESGDLERHRAYIDKVTRDAHTTALIGSFGDQPCLYVEAYWAREDRIAPFYDVQDFDRGWHVLVGEPAWRGRPYVSAWMPSVSHHLFLDDPRTQRLVIEPRIDNDKMLRSLALCGYAHLKPFDFPHKRAMLGMLLRDRFFDEALWHPRALPSPSPEHPRGLPHAHP
jgi:acetyl CoA:N6-hydroxylysine acetyl transferase